MAQLIEKNKNVIVLDVKTNGVYGLPYAICAIAYNAEITIPEEKRVFKQILINPVDYPHERTVAKMEELKQNSVFKEEEKMASYEQMLYNFRDWFIDIKSLFNDDFKLVVHAGSVCESMLFKQLEMLGLIKALEVPFPFIDTASILYSKQRNDQTDSYIDIIENANKIQDDKLGLIFSSYGLDHVLESGPVDTALATLKNYIYYYECNK